MDLNIFTSSSEVSHVDILNFVPGVVRAIAPNIYESNVYDPSQVPNNCSIALLDYAKVYRTLMPHRDISFL
jgi:hypothetical protein